MNEWTDNKNVRAGIIILVSVAALFLAVKTIKEFKSFNRDSRTDIAANVITTNGTGEVFAVADIASFSFSVVEQGVTVEAAQAKATPKINKAIEYLKKAGIEEKDIKTAGYNAYPQYQYQTMPCINGVCSQGKQTISAYEVSQTIEVKVRDSKKAGEILGGVGALGVSNVSGLQFTIDKEDVLYRQARQQAIDEAKENAELLAKDLGVHLVRIVSFYENNQGNMPYYDKMVSMDGRAEAQNAAGPQLPQGENKIVSDVSITYEIR